jgi:hypothetical protein
MPGGAPSLFVYYRVRAADLAAAAAAIRRLHEAWQASMPGLRCDLMRRLGDAPDTVTLMEIYQGTSELPSAWQQRMQSEARLALSPWLLGNRSVEVFAPCA